MENRESRVTVFAGSRFYPASAAVCVCSTTSAWISTLCGRSAGSAVLDQWIEMIVGAFFIAALIFSTIGAFSLTIA